MTHVFGKATTGRSKCRGCRRTIAKDTDRFGEQIDNPFADGKTTLWFHIDCAACRRPASFLEFLENSGQEPPGRERLKAIAAEGVEQHRLERISGAGLAPTGRAKCRHCREKIDKDTWRVALEFFEEGAFNPSGFVHAGCASGYFGTAAITDRLRVVTDLGDDHLRQLEQALS